MIAIPCCACVGVEGVIICDINKERVDMCDTVSEGEAEIADKIDIITEWPLNWRMTYG